MSELTKVSWQVMLDDADWKSDVGLDLPTSEGYGPLDVDGTRSRRTWWLTASVVALVLMAAGLYVWHEAQQGLAQMESDIMESLALDSQARQNEDVVTAQPPLDSQADTHWHQGILTGIGQGEDEGPVEVEVLSLNLRDNLAMARLLVSDPALPYPYREIRFYRETLEGWLRTQPAPAFWGRQERLESQHFVFHYWSLDRAAVAEASPIMDKRYAHNRDLLGLPIPQATTPDEKMQVFVNLPHDLGGGRSFQVASPWQRNLPASLTDADFLVESMNLMLRQRLVVEARDTAPTQDITYMPSIELLRGVKLWLVWQNEGLLAQYRVELVRWLYADAPAGPSQQTDSHAEICQTLDGLSIQNVFHSLPISCTTPRSFLSDALGPPQQLAQLPISMWWEEAYPSPLGTDNFHASRIYVQGGALAMVTVLEYATQTYGSDVVPRLLEAAVAGESWPTVARDLFGVTLEEFQAGWLDYLAEEYGVNTADLDQSS